MTPLRGILRSAAACDSFVGYFDQHCMQKTSETRVRVRYKETDQMGIAHHGNYIVWFEVARTDLCRDAGFSYREIEQRGLILVVTEIGCSYRAPFRYDDTVVIETGISRAASRSLTFSYRMSRETGERCAEGFSRHIWLDEKSRSPILAPRDVMEMFQPYISGA